MEEMKSLNRTMQLAKQHIDLVVKLQAWARGNRIRTQLAQHNIRFNLMSQ
jgi:hypothetical protein